MGGPGPQDRDLKKICCKVVSPKCRFQAKAVELKSDEAKTRGNEKWRTRQGSFLLHGRSYTSRRKFDFPRQQVLTSTRTCETWTTLMAEVRISVEPWTSLPLGHHCGDRLPSTTGAQPMALGGSRRVTGADGRAEPLEWGKATSSGG